MKVQEQCIPMYLSSSQMEMPEFQEPATHSAMLREMTSWMLPEEKAAVEHERY